MLDFRLYEPQDFGGCLDLIRAGHDPGFSASRFRWLHEQGPGGPSQMALCLADRRIVGIYSVVPKPMLCAGQDLVGGRDVDPVVHPSARGQGVFTRLLEFGLAEFRDLDFMFNFANSASAPGFRKAGWRQATALSDRIHQLGFRSPAGREFPLWIWSRLIRPRPRPTRRAVTAAELAELLSSDVRFQQPELQHYGTATRRDAAYLRWRYLEHPLHTYEYYLCEPTPDSVCLAVCRSSTPSRLDVVDIAGFGALPRLADWLPDWSAAHQGKLVSVWHTLPPESLRGFFGNPISRRTGTPLLVRTKGNRKLPLDLWSDHNWYLTRGDLEVS